MNFNVKFKEETPPFNVKFGWNNGEFEAGKAEGAREEYDRFWDVYQDYGNRIDYTNAFGGNYRGCYWTEDTLKPKYDMSEIYDATNMFLYNKCISNLDNLNVKIDFKNAISLRNTFNNSSIESIGVLNLINCSGMDGVFYNCPSLKTIDKLIFSTTIKTTFTTLSFASYFNLESITVGGTIFNDISFSDSALLTKANITSVINALSDTEVGKTATFSQTAKKAAFTAEEWAELIGTKPNWTIALA